MSREILAQNGDLKVVRSPHGWGVLDPQPSPEAVEAYYGRLDGEYGTPDGRAWLAKERREHEAGLWKPFYKWQLSLVKETWYLLDVGAGAGWLLSWWCPWAGPCSGIEPSRTATKASPRPRLLFESRDEWLKKHKCSFYDFSPPSVVRFGLVLEHVSDPVDFLRQHLAWPGLDVRKVMIIAPNEFNPLQKAVVRRDRRRGVVDQDWFVTRRHLNYFDPPGLRALFRQADLRVAGEHATFPMELFVLAGLDYRERPNLGNRLHLLRLRFEKTLGPAAFRLYKILYDRLGWGRELVFIGELDDEKFGPKTADVGRAQGHVGP